MSLVVQLPIQSTFTTTPMVNEYLFSSGSNYIKQT